MHPVISIGKQNFASLRENNCFYIDKSDLIREWWESQDEITLITRPRRFGKTLNMSMLNNFFSNLYTDKKKLFEDLSVWKEEKYQKLQGTYPVIFISFATIKGADYQDARDGIIMAINEAYSEHRYLLEWNGLTEGERRCFEELDNYAKNPGMKEPVANDTICNAVKNLSNCLYRYYEKKVLILLDEYDTPMQEAYLYEYWEEFIAFIRNFFNATFKTNPYLERAMMTGITRVSKESVFSDLNNLNVVTTTSEEYESSFGFTEEEVFHALETMGMSQEKQLVKSWYDGYHFGRADVYCPWDVINHVDHLRDDSDAKPQTYWINSSGNSLVRRLINRADSSTKDEIERLIAGEAIEKVIRLDLTYDEIDNSIDNIWSVLFTTGYLTKIGEVKLPDSESYAYKLVIPNKEVREVFVLQIQEWFKAVVANENDTMKLLSRAILDKDEQQIARQLNIVMGRMISILDTKAPDDMKENFYHGLLLGLLRGSNPDWLIKSNRESGDGFSDILIKPEDPDAGIIIEVKYAKEIKGLDAACDAAMAQIKDKRYDEALRDEDRCDILAYGIAFCRKRCRVVGEKL